MHTPIRSSLHAALRSARRHPAFAAAVVLTLALGIGANTAIFTVMRAVLLAPLPFTAAARLVALQSVEAGDARQPFSLPDYQDLRGSRALDGLVGWSTWSASLTGIDEPLRLQVQGVTGGFFDLLGVRPALGRLPSADEERPGGGRVALLGDGLWRSQFGGDRAVLGRTLSLNGEPFTVIGVLPRGFVFFSNGAQLVAPLVEAADPRAKLRGAAFLRLVGRLRPRVTAAQTEAELGAIVAGLRAAHPDTNASRVGVRAQPLLDALVGNHRRSLWFLQAAVAVVLLIACANLANLALARVLSRRAELALRTALGASRRDLLRQLLAESGVLALGGGLLGLGVAFAGVRALLAFGPAQLPRASAVAIDLWVVGFDLALAIGVGLALGILPALHGSRLPAAALRGGGRGALSGGGGLRARGVLVAVEVGLSLVLLVGATLLLRSLERLRGEDPGFDADHRIALQLALPKRRYASPDALTRYGAELQSRLAALPGVSAAAVASLNPLTVWRANVNFVIAGRADLERATAPVANYRAVGPGYFATLGIPLLAGRDVTTGDGAASPAVALVSRTLAQRYFAGRDPLGARLQIDDQDPWRTVEIVGVVGDVKYTGLDAEGTADVWVPFAQTPPVLAVYFTNIFCAVVRTQGDPRALLAPVRRTVRELDPDVAAASVRTMEDTLWASLAERRFQTGLLELFGAAALALALAGIHVVTAFAVADRTRELGLRVSLGATRGDVFALVFGRAMAPVAVGLAAGGAVTLALGGLVSGLLYGVAARDPGTLLAAALVLGAAAIAASAGPALRATRVDPAEALRAE